MSWRSNSGFEVDLLHVFLAVISDQSALWRFQGEETDMFRIDMSGFKARGDIATLVGAPKGYQDSKDGGTLTTFMASHPVRSTSTESFPRGLLFLAVPASFWEIFRGFCDPAFSLEGFSLEGILR